MQHMHGAGRTLAAVVQPVPVGIKAILDVVFRNCDAVFEADLRRQMPSFALHFEQLEVTFVVGVAKLGMGQFM